MRIARLVAAGHVRVIITTNFDRLIENALREHGVEPTVIASVMSLTIIATLSCLDQLPLGSFS